MIEQAEFTLTKAFADARAAGKANLAAWEQIRSPNDEDPPPDVGVPAHTP